MIYQCCELNRKAAVLGNPTLNGINYLELLDQSATVPADSLWQQTLLVHCLNKAPTNLTPSNILIIGGESITGITAQWIGVASVPSTLSQATTAEVTYFGSLPDAANTLVIRTSVVGDFSTYTLRLVNNATQAQEDTFVITEALTGFDPLLAEVKFSFRVNCPPYFDCQPAPPDCPPDLPTPPPINYLAKDYGSFRTIMLDRLNQLMPNWGGSSEADLGVALAELISYVGDQLSYRQDAIATEAYIETARSRISLRRHAILVDYHVHDGCNARAWVCVQVAVPLFLDHTITRFYTYAPGMPSTLAVGAGNEQAALNAGVIVFEPMQDAQLYPELNQLSFYTWGNNNCCLPIGATEATLLGSFPNLQPGDVLIFQEMMGPQTGDPADADIRHRYAVRLTAVTTQTAQGQPLVDPLFEAGTGNVIVSASQTPTPVTEIQWSTDDALQFPVCISSTPPSSDGTTQTFTNVSVAFGNVVLADQGFSFTGISLPTVPQPTIFLPPDPAADRCNPQPPQPLPVRYRPQVPTGPVPTPITQAVPLALAESPITPGIVQLLPNAFVSLTDANGNICLMVQADQPLAWPQYFGIVCVVDGSNFDLSVVFNPPGASQPIYLETFLGLTVTPTNATNYAPTQINTYSQFIRVPSTYAPPGSNPVHFPLTPTMLSNTGPVNLVDTGGSIYLTVQPTSPTAWPPNFGILAQGDQLQPDSFNLLVVYNPPSGGLGVQVPVVVETFNNLTLATISQTFTSTSDLITVLSFDEEPSPTLSAYDLMNYDANQAVPEITLTTGSGSTAVTWTPEPDLLSASATSTNFVVEIDTDGTAYLRFGDNINGLFPPSGTVFTAAYRLGNGSSGNVGANTLTFFAGDPRIQACTNPLPATGGVDPETNDQIRRRAPQAFMTQERAITMLDYENVVEMNSQVENAVATLRWTGSWYTVFITAEPQGAGNLTQALQKAIAQNVNRYRLAGQDIQLESPQYVPLQIALTICVDPEYFQADVEQSLLQVLGTQIMPNGQMGLFYPDNFTFGQTVYLSPIYAAAHQVAGVLTVTATVFQPQGPSTQIYLNAGEIPLGPFQIARMDNDPSLPNNGQLTLNMQGGK
jgi:hypothetical protein